MRSKHYTDKRTAVFRVRRPPRLDVRMWIELDSAYHEYLSDCHQIHRFCNHWLPHLCADGIWTVSKFWTATTSSCAFVVHAWHCDLWMHVRSHWWIRGCLAMQASSAGAQYSGRDRFGVRCRSLVAEHSGQGGGMVASCRFSVDGTECSLRRLAASEEGRNRVTLLWGVMRQRLGLTRRAGRSCRSSPFHAIRR